MYFGLFYDPEPLHVDKAIITDSVKSELVDTMALSQKEQQSAATSMNIDREVIRKSLISTLSEWHYDYSRFQNTPLSEIDSMTNMLTENLVPLLPELSYSDFE
jgi:hypothetical protein